MGVVQCLPASFQDAEVKVSIYTSVGPNMPLRLYCDASAYDVGAVLSHTFPDGTERPIAYASFWSFECS